MFKITSLLLTIWLVATVNWFLNFEDAQKEAKQYHKKIVLYFSGSDWCAPCIQLKKKVLETPTFESYAREELVLLKADFPRLKKNQLMEEQKRANQRLAERYNPQGRFPLLLILDENGEKLMEIEGYSDDLDAEVLISKIKEL